MKMMFILLITACLGQDASEEAKTPSICGDQSYWGMLEQKCLAMPSNCADGHSDTFYGCKACDPDDDGKLNYAFKGACKPCTCGFDNKTEEVTFNELYCKNEVGCEKCDKGYVMKINEYSDGSHEYTCEDIGEIAKQKKDLCASESTEEGKSECEKYQYTDENCDDWGDGFGCTKCVGNTYRKDGYCYHNRYCDNFTINEKIGESVCESCKEVNGLHYYLGPFGNCIPCDENCINCDVNTGRCDACFPGYVRLTLPPEDQPDNSVAGMERARKCYQCDPNCDINSCMADPLKKRGISCSKCREGYFLVNGERCVRCPEGCSNTTLGNCVDEIGCKACDDVDTHFLIPNDYLGEGKFHFNFSDVRIGYCIPHQEICAKENRTEFGCSGCPLGYVLDKVTYKRADGTDYWNGFCSGASQLMVIVLIALLFIAF